MICVLFGHKDASEKIKCKLENCIIDILSENEYVVFYAWNNGNFDRMAQCVLEDLSTRRPALNYLLYLSKIDEVSLGGSQTRTVYLESLHKVPKRFAISKRNDFLIKNADMALIYVNNRFSNTYKISERLKKRGVRIINIKI